MLFISVCSLTFASEAITNDDAQDLEYLQELQLKVEERFRKTNHDIQVVEEYEERLNKLYLNAQKCLTDLRANDSYALKMNSCANLFNLDPGYYDNSTVKNIDHSFDEPPSPSQRQTEAMKRLRQKMLEVTRILKEIHYWVSLIPNL